MDEVKETRDSRKYVVEVEWRAGSQQYEPEELLALLREAIGMDGYDLKWYSCELEEFAETLARAL